MRLYDTRQLIGEYVRTDGEVEDRLYATGIVKSMMRLKPGLFLIGIQFC